MYSIYKASPPCTNIVRWHVMNAKSYIGKTQIARFRELMFTANATMAPNYRETQENINSVYACFEEEVEEDIETLAEKTEKIIVWIYAVFITIGMFVFGGVCYSKSRQNTGLLTEDTTGKRTRLASKSSFGHTTDFSRQSSHGSRHGSVHEGQHGSRHGSQHGSRRGSMHDSNYSLHGSTTNGGH